MLWRTTEQNENISTIRLAGPSLNTPLQVVNLVSVLSAAILRMISEGLVDEHLNAVSATSFGFAGFHDGVQLTNLVFLNSEGHNNAAAESFKFRLA